LGLNERNIYIFSEPLYICVALAASVYAYVSVLEIPIEVLGVEQTKIL
jgi:hypothetical protein